MSRSLRRSGSLGGPLGARIGTLALAILSACAGSSQSQPTRAPEPKPARAALATPRAPEPPRPSAHGSKERIEAAKERIRASVRAGIEAGKFPGCVVAFGTHDGVLYKEAFGDRALEPAHVAMTEDTVFDLASLTKPLATATSVMALVERGKVDLDAPVARYVPSFARFSDGKVTVRELLLHTSGLPAETRRSDYRHSKEYAVRHIALSRPRAHPGELFRYSDAGFIILESLVARASQKNLSAFATDAVFGPAGMHETTFLPGEALRARAAPTEKRDDAWIVGEVHDPRAHWLGGYSGHAGLFSTIDDVARYARMILGRGTIDGRRVFAPETIDAMLAPHSIPEGVRALGWDVRTAYTLHRGSGWSPRAIGHGGYTGTVLWIDPDRDFFYVLLSNRVHPNASGKVNDTAWEVGTAVAAAFDMQPAPPPDGKVALGIDQLASSGFRSLEGKRVGLLTNTAARDSHGKTTLEVIAKAKAAKLVRVFAPEHGLSVDSEGRISDASHPAFGVVVRSLYGPRYQPEASDVADLDAIVVDLPDVGTRFFTYASTMHRLMRVAADAHVPVVVLDRPNPLGGVAVEGPSDLTRRNFVNHHPLAVRHGLTLGELAVMIDADEHLGTRLSIVRSAGWKREMYWDDARLAWVSPSPNLRSVREAVLYPAIGLVEATNVSVGRGTDHPFEVVGAPWIDEHDLTRDLRAIGLDGVDVEPIAFTPTSSVHANKVCHGVRFTVRDRQRFRAVHTGIELARVLFARYKSTFDVDKMSDILMAPAALEKLKAGEPAHEIEATWHAGLEAFAAKRELYLLYREAGASRAPGSIARVGDSPKAAP